MLSIAGSRRSFIILLAVGFIFGLNIFFYQYLYATRSYLYSGDSEYYIINKDAIKDDSLTNGLESISHNDILKQLASKIKEEDTALIEEVKQKVKEEFFDEYKESLRKEVATDYTKKLFALSEKSFNLYDSLASEYLKNHEQEIKDYIVKDVLSDINSKNFNIDKIESNLKMKFDKKEYYRYLLEDILIANGPKTPKITRKGRNIQSNMYREVRNPIYSKNFLTKLRVRLNADVFNDLQINHDNVVKVLKSLELPSKSIFSGDGIVISSGGKYFGGALVTIGQIREMGSKLPIEVIFNYEDEYDREICEKTLPALNATCLVLEKEIGKSLLEKLKLEKFQLKILGLLISSFDNTITLDADNLPLKNVDHLLTSEPYLSTKFLLWPDVWHKGTSPLYYDIARLNVGEVIHREGLSNEGNFDEYVKKNKDSEVMFHDREGTLPGMGVETGQMVFSKQEHFRSYLLSLYYNIYGTKHYYPLLYQGVYGSGDRETFIPALHVFNEPYHLNTYNVWLAGYYDAKNAFKETTIVQYDPSQSVKFFDDWKDWLNKKQLDTRLWPFQDNEYSKNLFAEFKSDPANYSLPDVYFLHIHKTKINPIFNYLNNDGQDSEVYKRRNIGLPNSYPEFGEQDWELKFSSIAKWVACETIKSENYWNNLVKVDKQEVCNAVGNYVDFLKKDSKDINSSKLHVLENLLTIR